MPISNCRSKDKSRISIGNGKSAIGNHLPHNSICPLRNPSVESPGNLPTIPALFFPISNIPLSCSAQILRDISIWGTLLITVTSGLMYVQKAVKLFREHGNALYMGDPNSQSLTVPV